MGERARSFGPTVLAGVAGGVLLAVSATRTWAAASGDAAGLKVEAATSGAETSPLTAALGLVALAAWGVVLVTRARVRRVVSVLGILAATGALLGVAAGFGAAQDDALRELMGGPTGDTARVTLTAWYYLAGVGALLTGLAFVVAVLRSPGWPAMGAKYDAPTVRRDRTAAEEDMWRALDEGRDPTS